MAEKASKTAPIVYLADDAADYRLLVQQVFARYLPQYDISLFSGGETLISHMQASPVYPALILLDLYMPGQSGRETLVHLKQEPTWKMIPIVMVTSSTSANEIQACYEAGANSCLAKPLGLEPMRQLFEQVCSYWVDMNEPLLE